MDLIKLPGITQPQHANSPIYSGSHFTWGEATRYGERMPCDTEFDGDTIPAAQITSNIIKLAHELDKIRSHFGDRPIHVTSWLRPPDVNKDVGGVRNSQHLLGWAADILVSGIDPNDVAAKLTDTWPGGLGDSSVFTHVDMRHLMDRASARWDYGFA
jgi:zinc D-Ala-D-Ala carboxypeptidase